MKESHLETKKKELKQLLAKGERNRISNNVVIQEMKDNLTRLKKKAIISERPLHEYTSALRSRVQKTPSPPTYVLQKQSILCRAMHREGMQSNALHRVKTECNERLRRYNSKKTIQDLREECASMELVLLKRIVILNDELSYLKQQDYYYTNNNDNNNSNISKKHTGTTFGRRIGKTITTTLKKKYIEEEKKENNSDQQNNNKSFLISFENISNFIAYQRDSSTTTGTPIFSRKTIHAPPVA